MRFGTRNDVVNADKLAVARLLAVEGPISGGDASESLGWTADRWWKVVERSGDWFTLTGRGWMLTEEGRDVIEPVPV